MNKQFVYVLVIFGVSFLAMGENRQVAAKLEQLRSRSAKEKWTFEVGYTPAMDYSLEELTGLIVPEDWKEKAKFVVSRVSQLPAHFDWREEAGGLTPIKNQKSCGSCWAFGTVAVIENVIKIRDKITLDLSEQQLVSCNRDGWSCGGGWFAHKYHINPGATSTEQFPYTAKDSSCKSGTTPVANIPSWSYVGSENTPPSVDQIKQAIFDYGPVAVTITANSAMQSYKGGIFNSCSNSQINHLVNLVGWDDAGGYWIMRNSWGASWGEQGYMRIKYRCSRVGEMTTFVNYKAPCNPQPMPYVGGDKEITFGDSIFIGGMPIPGQTYQWTPTTGLDNPSFSRPLASPTKTTTYKLKVTNECGTAEQSVKITVK